tara:strand:- start:132 stop:320 length:189 start_codon:yes stop_codon:yes gene_type:complete
MHKDASRVQQGALLLLLLLPSHNHTTTSSSLVLAVSKLSYCGKSIPLNQHQHQENGDAQPTT